MADSSIKNKQMCGDKIHVVDLRMSLKETHKEVIKPMWKYRLVSARKQSCDRQDLPAWAQQPSSVLTGSPVP